MVDLTALNKALSTQSYVKAGTYLPTGEDFSTFAEIGSADLSKFPNVARWHRHIATFDAPPSSAPVASSSAAAEPAAAAADDEFDLFAEDDDDEEAKRLEAERVEKLAAAKKAKEAAEKPKIIEKSVVILDVKPWDSEQDLAVLEAKIRNEVVIEGLEWKAAEQKDIGYGIKKLVISCHIIDSIVSVDDIQEAIQNFEDDVQSTDIAAFSKL